MTIAKDEKQSLLDIAVQVIKESGGAKGIRAGLTESQAAWRRMDQEKQTLLRTYPNKWVAMSKDGVVAADDSLEGVFVRVEESGLLRNAVKVGFIDADPKTIIL